MLALSAESRKAVDTLIDAAGINGGKADINPKQDHGFMYGRSSRIRTGTSGNRCSSICHRCRRPAEEFEHADPAM